MSNNPKLASKCRQWPSTRDASEPVADARRSPAMKILATTVLFISCTVSANQAQIVDGNYLRYEGTEFESVFFPCQSSEVWSIAGGQAFDALVDYYRNSRTNKSGEIRTALKLNVSSINKMEHPNSHIDAVAEVIAIVSIAEDENEIISCREESK